MTCEEFRAMLKRSPRDCTTAERTAHHRHKFACAECSDLVPTLTDDEVVALMGRERFDMLGKLVAKDLADPEG